MKQDPKIPAEEIEARTGSVQSLLQGAGIDGLFVVQKADRYYFSGTDDDGCLYIPAQGEPLLLVRENGRYPRIESPLERQIEFNRAQSVPSLIHDFYGTLPRVLGLELDVLPVNDFNLYKTWFPEQKCVDGSSCILNTRAFKSDWEIERMEETGDVVGKTFDFMKANVQAGLTEMVFAGMAEAHAGELTGRPVHLWVRDYLTEGYPWHILSGESGGMVGVLDSPSSGEGLGPASPCGAGNKSLAANEPIMVDFNYELNHYHMDITRMFSIGPMPDIALRASEAVIEIHDHVLSNVRPGVPAHRLFEMSVSKAQSLGYEEQYLGSAEHKVSFIGHGIGLELIEPPFMAAGKNDLLQAGMTFALEPKMVFEGAFSVGVESVFLVTEDGYRLLSAVPVEVFIC
jgi:Xaa-Pro aminopeptidase